MSVIKGNKEGRAAGKIHHLIGRALSATGLILGLVLPRALD
jgi:hypothetical protein